MMEPGTFGAWVAMDERLPPTGTPILVRAFNGTIAAACFEHEPDTRWVWWNGAGFGGYDWSWNWPEETDKPWRGVTHWMPLPDGPDV